MILPITTEPNPILHQVGARLSVAELKSDKIQKFIIDLTETMYQADGVGIAAPQVNQSIQLCVIAKQYSGRGAGADLVLVNPVWTKMSVLKKTDEEGCLSVPHIYGKVKRYTKIKVKALDSNGRPIEFIAKDFPARVIQHETDHLNGILFIEKAKDLHKIETV
ncbi:MAG: peptide deformylase [Candidatus Magasanikbacteria bacterium]